MSTNLERLIQRRDSFLEKVKALNQLIDEKTKKKLERESSVRKIVKTAAPKGYPKGGTWAERCIYLLKEADGKDLTRMELAQKARRHETGPISIRLIDSGLLKLRSSQRKGFHFEKRKPNVVYWVDLNELAANPEPEISMLVLETYSLPKGFGGRSLAEVVLPTGSRAIRILQADGSIDIEVGKVKTFLRKVNTQLGLNVELKRANGSPTPTNELGREILAALRAQKEG